MQKLTKRRGLAIILALATLIVAAAVILIVVSSADPVEFDDVGYQTLSALDVADDDYTDLRFFFTIGKLDYEEVGFVFSKSNPAPTIGGDKVYKYDKDTVYRSITANGTPMAASAGRFWVTARLEDVPHEYFDGTLYVRPYVKDALGTRYDDTQVLTVCSAAGHTHVIENEDLTETVTATLDHPSARIGHCDGCKLDNVVEYGETAALEYKKWVGGGSEDHWYDSYQMSTIKNGKHFYPDASNDYQGNDLYAEFSILWNETLYNFDWDYSDGARLEAKFASNSSLTDNAKAIGYMALTDNTRHAGSKIAGAFEFPCEEIKTSEPGNPYSDMVKNEQGYSAYPNIAGTDPDHPEWGWHRIGIKYHEDVTNLDAVESTGADAEYKLTVTIYIDGRVVSVLSGTDLTSDKGNYDYKLYTVEKVDDDLVYTDIADSIRFSPFRIYDSKAATHDAYIIDGDGFATCGQSFVLPVTRIDNPAARTETVDGKVFTAPFYYTTVGSHDHVWGELENDASPFADCETAATKSAHCTVCGATADASTVNLAVDPARHSYTAYKTYQAASPLLGDGVERRTCTCCGAHQDRTGAARATATAVYGENWDDSNSAQYADRKLLSEIQSGTHFYPTPENPDGKDLLIEYSVLWNHTLLNLDPGTDKATSPFIETELASWSNTEVNTLAWWSPTDDIYDSWCKYAGGFEPGALQLIHSEGASYTPAAMISEGGNYAAYPNIGGATPADAENLDNGHEWGWHHVQIRFHQEVRNADKLADGRETTGKYEFVLTTYVDGVPISMLRGTESTGKRISSNNYLFTAKYEDGEVKYYDNAKLTGGNSVKRTVWAYRLNTRKALEGKTVYWEEADIHYTCGTEFAMKVEKVATPAYVDYEIGTDVHVNAAVYYQFK